MGLARWREMFFDSWGSIGRTVWIGGIAYTGLIVILRTSGKRTLAKMNAFDLVVTVALGSTLSTIAVSRQVPLADGLVALALLVGLQYVVAWSSVRSERFERLVKTSASLLAYRGELCRKTMRDQRVSEEEVHAAVRSAGLPNLTAVGAVVLESDGSFSVIPEDALPGSGAITGVETEEARDSHGARAHS